MTKKIIPFEISLKSTKRAGFTFQPRPQILTNDANAAELNFIITDTSAEELAGSTATVLLFMKDGSFFQNTDVTRVNNTFVYTIKPNQAKHKGVAQAQLVIKIGTVENASPLMEFEIIGGLETKPIVEREIQDWTSLTAEAKAFVDQIEGFTLESFVENKMGEELANLEVNYAGRLTGLETADQNLTAQLDQIKSITGSYKIFKKMVAKQTAKIVCIGDSMTYGTNSTDPLTYAYPVILQNRLRDFYNYSDIVVVNKGVPGTSSTDGKTNFAVQVLAEVPDVVIVMYGINDSNLDLSIDTYRSNLEYIVTQAKANDIDVILCSPTQAYGNNVPLRTKLPIYRKVVEMVASAYNVMFVDTYKMGEEIYEGGDVLPNLVGDETHFADSNYNLLADVVCAHALVPATFLRNDISKDVIIPALSNNVVANVANKYKDAINFETGGFAWLKKSIPTEYVKCPIYVRGKSFDLYLIHCSHTTFGDIQVLNNGVVVATLKGQSEVNNSIGVRKYVCRLTQGLNIITLNASSLSDTKEFAVEGFQIVKNKFLNVADSVANTDVTTEILTPIFNRLKTSVPVALGAGAVRNTLIKEKDLLYSLQPNKTLVIEYDHLSDGISGIGWFMNRLYIGTSYTLAYNLRIYNNQALFAYNNTIISQPVTTTAYGTTHKIRIEHKYTGEIKIYINGTLLITVTDTKGTSGYLSSFMTQGTSYIDIKNLNIGYI